MTIYKVTHQIKETAEVRLIDAKTRAAAVAHVAQDTINAERCTVADAMTLARDGIEVEAAK